MDELFSEEDLDQEKLAQAVMEKPEKKEKKEKAQPEVYSVAEHLDGNVEEESREGAKIAAIVMIADASEAAARALGDRSPAAVERVVRSIIEERMDLDQFDECDITMKDLTTIKETIVSYCHRHLKIKFIIQFK